MQPGDLDYEYMRLLLCCFGSCLRPNLPEELAGVRSADSEGGDATYAGGRRPLPQRPTRGDGDKAGDALPEGWSVYSDPESGDLYYSNGRETTWERPTSAALAVC